MRDTGCDTCIIRSDLVTCNYLSGPDGLISCHLANGQVLTVPRISLEVKCCYFNGIATVLVFEKLSFPFILGNIPGAKFPTKVGHEISAVETRNSARQKELPLPKLPSISSQNFDLSPDQISKMQKEDKSLSRLFLLAEVRPVSNAKNSYYLVKKNLLYRIFTPPIKNKAGYRPSKQLVVPSRLRSKVLHLAHSSNFSGHLGITKTYDRLSTSFYWPGMYSDVTRFCLSCDTCQRMGNKPTKVPLGSHPIISEPFDRIAVDLIGPIVPSSHEGHRFILVAVDYGTRYPLAIALKKIDSQTIADALLDMFSQVGIPKEMLSDNGSQFTSDLMSEVTRLLSIKQLKTTVYNPRCNGLVESLNGTLKQMLKRLCKDQPKEWNRFISPCLFALRQVVNESTGFSPFSMIYGRIPRGPVEVLKELWTQENDSEVKTTYQYVLDLANRLELTHKLAVEHTLKSKSKQKEYYDRTAKERVLQSGDQVLVLLPTKKNKLELAWRGPYDVISKKNEHNYLVRVSPQKEKLFHINLLKKYLTSPVFEEDMSVFNVCCATIIEEENTERSPPILHPPSSTVDEDYKQVDISSELNNQQKNSVENLLYQYQHVLTNKPGCTDLIQHKIELISEEPFRKRPYVIPHALRETMKKEIDDMLTNNIIEPSNSEYCSPCLLVKKADSISYRFVFDGRSLNKITKFDCEPLPNMNSLLDSFHKAKYLSCLDLCKGFWQIPVEQKSRHLLSFITDLDSSTFQFCKLPFGLLNSSQTFSRLMRIVLKDMVNVKNYVDDIVVFTTTWSEHLAALKELFTRLDKAGLTVKPSKVKIGYAQIEFLGHIVGNGCKRPVDNKVKAIVNAQPPTSKKVMRSFLGLLGFYRQYIPNFAEISACLSDTTKKDMPRNIKWNPQLDLAFNKLKSFMTKEPILRLPDFTKQFTLQTDASGIAVAGVLLQEHEGQKFPVLYVGRKLLDRETRYAIIEQECLALVYCLEKLKHYLLGVHFILETDASALLYLNKQKHSSNGRLTRWSLQIQEFRFTVVAIRGKDNHCADFLSRCPQL